MIHISAVIWYSTGEKAILTRELSNGQLIGGSSVEHLFHAFPDEIKLITFHEDRIWADVFALWEYASYKANKSGFIEWDCEKSPDGTCSYNVLDDPAMDSCIYCGQPLERK